MPSKLVPFCEGKKYCIIHPENLVSTPYSNNSTKCQKLTHPVLFNHSGYAKYSKSVNDLKSEKTEITFIYNGKSDSPRSYSPTTSINSGLSSNSDNGLDSGVSSEQDASPPRIRKGTTSVSNNSDSDIDSSISSDSLIDTESNEPKKQIKSHKKKLIISDTLLEDIKEKAREMRKRRKVAGDFYISSHINALDRAKSYQRSGRLARLHSLSSIPQELRYPSLGSSNSFGSMNSLTIEDDSSSTVFSEYNRSLYECRDKKASCGFAGISEIFAPQQESTIKSAKGTVRGVKNRVRAGIATFTSDHRLLKIYTNRERGKVVIYVTTLGIIRETYERCLRLRKILWTLLVRFDERDTFMARDTQMQLFDRLRERRVTVPHVFLEGQYLGGVELIEKLNETGELRKLLQPYMKPANLSICDVCGGFRLLPCIVCSGSKKSVHRNDFTSEFIALKCSACDESGLVQCSECLDCP